jgi:hypothetical protein
MIPCKNKKLEILLSMATIIPHPIAAMRSQSTCNLKQCTMRNIVKDGYKSSIAHSRACYAKLNKKKKKKG